MVYAIRKSGIASAVSLARGLAVSAAILGLGLAISPAEAQQKAPAAPAAAPKKKAEPAKKPQNAWVKLCETQASIDKKICLTHHERLDGNTGMVLVSAAVRKVEGQDKEAFMVMVPLGMAIPPGIQVRIDDGDPINLKYTICHAAGCTAEAPASKDVVDKLKKGNKMVVAAINLSGKAIGFPVPLTGFTKAYQGGPVDSKKYQEARRQLMQMIRKRQVELAKKAAEAKKQGQGQPAPAAQPKKN